MTALPSSGVNFEPTATYLLAREALDERSPILLAQMPADWEQDDWERVENAPEPIDDGTKSVKKAVGLSLLLPGLGERYVGNTGRANVFHAVEAGIWAMWGFYRIQGELREDRYVEYAEIQGGASPAGDADYYEHIGLWISLEEWHDIVRRDARLRFPDDPEAQAEFFETNKRYDVGEAWEWSNDDVRTEYRQLRSRSERSYRNARLFVGAALFNRFASMIDALALARRHNSRLEEDRAHLRLRVEPRYTADGLVIMPVLSATY